ncbi:MAG: hypothetical protein KDD06_12165 [Phaeodactylibacter sp.]|nr:hypothetical protein [Phaeodactylibacter sp.]MCB9263563.1 hypothetical protein [Lewinellaceae bacterium]
MTKFFLKFSGLAVLLTFLIATGCQEDNPIIENPLGPEIALNAEAGFVSGDVELLENEAFSVKITVTPGDNPLSSLTLLKDGASIPAASISDYVTKITSNSEDILQQNPLGVDATRENGATYIYDMTPFGQLEGETSTYTFQVTDKVQEKASVSFDVTIVAPPGTPLDTILTGILLNQAGPAGTGGLDLDTGTGTGSANAAAEIRDLGIDCTINQETNENWRAQIGSVNGTDMVKVDVSAQSEDFSFEKVDTKEAIIAAYDSGITLADGVSTAPSCAQTPVTDVSDKVVAGDLFVVKKGDVYYLIQVEEVNYVHGFAANPGINNDDNYVMSIKY